MKARERATMAAIRAALGAIDNAEATDAIEAIEPVGGDSHVIAGAVVGLGRSEVTRRKLTEQDVLALIRDEITVRDTAAAEYDALGGPVAEAAVTLRAQADALRVYVAD